MIHTRCGRTIAVSRFAPGVLPPELGRVVLDTACEPYDRTEVWASLTPGEARQLAGLLLQQAAAVERPEPSVPGHVEAVSVHGDVYAITTRGHLLTVDQPRADGGTATGPTAVELLSAALAGCVAHYAGRYLDRHGIARDGLRVTAGHTMAADRPARITAVAIRLAVPHLPPERAEALLAVASHCTVHNTLGRPPEVSITLEPERRESPIW
ncbi:MULTISPECIES: OsmC family protein [unclassified Kitasatospora]|uniref:OsmC family protein n=1 Tax=unclassified Kitasatospora TaxID=2633591 RepID=UPI0033D82686